MESVFNHHPLNPFESMRELFSRVQFAELQASSARQLIGGRVEGNSLDGDDAYKKIRRRQEAKPDAGSFGPFYFRLNIGKPARGEERLYGIVEGIAGQGIADFERCGCQ
jgi:hypothetical protein